MDQTSSMALVGWDEKIPPDVKDGDEVCFARHVLPRDEDAARKFTASWEEFGKPIMFMLYGRIVGEAKCIDHTRAPSLWKVTIEVWQAKTFQPLGFGTEMEFGDWDVDGRTEEGPIMDFEFRGNEALTVVRHTGTPV